ncbi:MAG: hypothetical protein ACKOXB_15080 [Flavobacteriales bacterium]
MNIVSQHIALRALALVFCSVFILQISLDIACKFSEKTKKELSWQADGSQEDDSSEDDQEKEKEVNSEDESKVVQQILRLSDQAQYSITTLQRHLKHSNLPTGFFETFTPPPKHNTSLS